MKMSWAIFIVLLITGCQNPVNGPSNNFSIYIESWERISFYVPHIAESDHFKWRSKAEAEAVIATHRSQMSSSMDVMLGPAADINGKGFESKIDEIQEWLVSQGMTHIVFRLAMGKADPPVVREYTNGRIVRPTLDGKSVTLEGRWNALSKEESQIICDTEPRIVDVINIGDLSKPVHNRHVKVVSILHWREMTPEQKKLIRDQKDMVPQGIPDGYIIDWPEAKWEYISRDLVR